MKTLLKELKEVIEIDYKESNGYDWDGSVSYSGVKRLIYGLWHKGKNEKCEDMIKWMSPTARKKYKSMIRKYEKTPFIKINFTK